MSNAIKYYRKKAQLTQPELARMCDISLDSVLRYEKGVREPKVSVIKKFCEALRVTESELLNAPKESELIVEVVADMQGMNELSNVQNNRFLVGVEGSDQIVVGGKISVRSEADFEDAKRKVALKLKVAWEILKVSSRIEKRLKNASF